MTTPYQIEVADIIQWLEEYEGPRFHAVLCDPPYALISIAKRFGPGQKEAQEGSDGRFRRLSGGFMGQEWDGFESMEHYQQWVATWAQLLIEKALHPGAICLFFGGTRTWHRLACGLEDGGFDIYDTFMWVYGSGFPKSHNISKFIDKRRVGDAQHIRDWIEGLGPREEIANVAGVTSRQVDHWIGKNTPCPQLPTSERIKRLCDHYDEWPDWVQNMLEVKGEEIGEKSYSRSGGSDFPKRPGSNAETRVVNEYGPGSSLSARWKGWGTGLKPAWEPVILARAPRGDFTYAQLAIEFGTGALNIDGSRISGSWTWGTQTDIRGGGYGENRPSQGDVYDRDVESDPDGRWPANFGMVHTDFCVKVAEVEGEGRKLNRYPSKGKGGSFAFYAEDHRGDDYDSEDTGSEVREVWACVPGCPVRALDDQAGVLSSPEKVIRRRATDSHIYGDGEGFQTPRGINDEQVSYGDSGGPSRFFYCAKASKSEKDEGLDGFHYRKVDDGWERIDDPSDYPDERILSGNIHPTVKPLEICRYLAKLVLPPELDEPRRILVPFAGSGSEMIGARQAEWDEVVGVELSDDFAEIAEARLRAQIGLF